MTIPTFPTLIGQQLPQRTSMWSTIKQKAISGRETRVQLYTYPQYHFEVGFDYLGSSAAGYEANTDYQTMVGFFDELGGAALPFHFTDPTDDAVTAQAMGIGDGNTASFNFCRTMGAFTTLVQDATQAGLQIFVSDWQGNLLYLSTSRTNWLKQSGAASVSPWSLTNMTATTGQTDPAGGTTAVSLTETVTNGVHSTAQTVAAPLPANNVTLTAYAYIIPNLTRTIAYMKVTNLAGTSFTAYFNLTGSGTVGTVSGSPISTHIVKLTSGYYRCAITFTSGATGSTAPTVTISPSVSGSDAGSYAGNTSDGFTIDDIQLENNTQPGAFILTTTAQLSQTDYSFETDANWGLTYGATFASAPLSAAAITWTGSYQWPCRFDDDQMEFGQVLNSFWELKKITFTSMKV